MKDTRACRSCLLTENRLVRIPDTWYRMFETLTGVQASKNDGYPNYFCVECKTHIQKAITFRKKSRRAFYVLKEIMMVRKEVNLPDILTVDRSRVSLDSSLGIFRPKRSAIYSLCTPEEGSPDLVKEDLNMVNTSVVIDIKGEIGEFPIEIPEEAPPLEDHTADVGNDFPDDNIGDNAQELDTEQNELEPEIDMNDIFKGLKEPESENSDEEVKPVEKPKKKKKRRKKGEPKVVKVKKEVADYSLRVIARALINYDVKELTDDEQREVFKKKINHPIFTRALYTCGICVKVMPSVTALMAHFEIHRDKTSGNHLCKICKDKFMTAEDLEQHTKENHMYQYTCKICEEVAYSIREMVKHKKEKHISRFPPREPVPSTVSRLKIIDYDAELQDKFLFIPLSEEDKLALFKKSIGVGKFICDICGLGLPTTTQRKCHWEMHVKKPKNPSATCRLQCGICGVWCWKHEGLSKHMEAFHDYNYHCKLCSYEASNMFLALDHLTRSHSELNACHICGYTSRTPYGLDFHMEARHKPLLRTHHCVLCGIGFKTQFSLYVHQFKEHTFFKFAEQPTEGAENACAHCNVQFLSQKAYHNHLVKAEHDEAKDLPWKCLPCRRLFDSEADYRTHAAENCKHNKTPASTFPAPCEICGEMMPNYRRYYYHGTKMHPELYLFNKVKKLCEMCGKTYVTNKYPLHACLRGTGKYKCTVCNIEFDRPTSVVFHVLKKHMKKPFSCTICNRTFKKRHNCKEHILKVHAPVRPYLCPICDREFSHIDFLKAHAKDMHDVQVELDIKITKKKNLFYLYPNMKVDLSLIDKNIVDEAKIKVADYTDQIFELLHDYKDYIITSEDIKRKVEQEGNNYKEFIIRTEDIKSEEPETSPSPKKTKTVKKTKKQAYRDFIFGNDDDNDQESTSTHQFKKKFLEFDINDERRILEQESARTNKKIKKELVITSDGMLLDQSANDERRILESARTSKQIKRQFVVTNDGMLLDQSANDERQVLEQESARTSKQIKRKFVVTNDGMLLDQSANDERRILEESAGASKQIKRKFVVTNDGKLLDQSANDERRILEESAGASKQIKRQFVVTNDGMLLDQSANDEHRILESARTSKQIKRQFVVTNDGRLLDQSASKQVKKELVIINDGKLLDQSARTSKFNQEYIVNKDGGSMQGESSGVSFKSPKQDVSNLIIRRDAGVLHKKPKQVIRNLLITSEDGVLHKKPKQDIRNLIITSEDGVLHKKPKQDIRNLIITSEDGVLHKKPKQDFRDFIISIDDVKRRREQSGPSPHKKSKFDNVEQEF